MARNRPSEQGLDPRRAARPLEDSLLRSGLVGIAAVALVTLGLLAVGGLIALLVSLVF